jgi:hypothetical protein
MAARHEPRFAAAFILAIAAVAAAPGGAAPRPASARPARADLADVAAGTYGGDVISDARGSSRSGVRIVVTKIGPNKVRVAPDYARMPAFTATLARYQNTIQNVGGSQVFLLDMSRTPPSLDVTVDDASWSGTKG